MCYDKDGQEQDESGGLMSERVCKAIQNDAITDVFIMSHGWKGDIPAAKEQYNPWIQAMAKCEADRKQIRQLRKDFKPLLVGFHWPSQPWGDEEIGMEPAPALPHRAARVARSSDAIAHYVDLYADRIADTPAARAALTTIFERPLEGRRRATSCRRMLPTPIGCSIGESGMGEGGPSAAPGDDREPFDPDRRLCATETGARPGALVRRRRTLGVAVAAAAAVVLEDEGSRAHARRVAGSTLLSSAQQAVPQGAMSFHLMGHSFGCIVVSAFLRARRQGRRCRAPVDSLTLVQGATRSGRTAPPIRR